jgi:hypothetical protein
LWVLGSQILERKVIFFMLVELIAGAIFFSWKHFEMDDFKNLALDIILIAPTFAIFIYIQTKWIA